ncbi:MAG: DUF2752 domain-containing protein [Acidimicrobiales bacterium]
MAAGGVLAMLTGSVALANPFTDHIWPACPLHALTGLWCPFCGGLRAVWAATHLQFKLMLHEDALLPAIAALAAWGWLAWLGRQTGRWRLPSPRNRTTDVIVIVVLIAFAILRNLPWFSMLAPLARP